MALLPADIKLFLFNRALLHLGARQLASLTEARESRRVLDTTWNSGLQDFVLEKGQWKFASRTERIEYTPSVEPQFGYRRAFTKPDDFIRLCALSADEYFREPLSGYSDIGLFWTADVDTIYVKYVSRDEGFGYDLTRWPPNFLEYVSTVLAQRAGPRIKNATTVDELDQKARKALLDSMAIDAQAEATKFAPQGRWARARSGGNSGRMMRRDLT